MTKTLLISGLLCSALAVACSKGEPGITEASDPTGTSGSSVTSGGDSFGTTSSVDPTGVPTTTTSTAPTATSDPGATGSDTGLATTAADATTVAETGEPSTTDGTDGTCGIICGDDTDGDPVGTIECDVFAQDCEDGQKCAAWAAEGGSWDATKCVPIHGDGAPGEPCMTIDGLVSGLDDCGKGSMCLSTDVMMASTCIELCQGTPEAATCSQGGPCVFANDGVLNLCMLVCDPLALDCANAGVCIAYQDGFVCAPKNTGDGQAYHGCSVDHDCDPGNYCGDAKLAPSNCVDVGACCIPFCNLDEMPVCPGMNTTCKSYYEEDTAPPGKENIGGCIE